MKRFLSILLVFVLCLTCFVGCGEEENEQGTTATTQKAKTLADAAKYLKASHIDDATETPIDYTLEGEVMGYKIEWSTDNKDIKITRDGKWVKVGIPTGADATELTVCEEIPYKLIATISDGSGKKETVTFKRKIPAAIRGPQELIVEAAYALEENALMEGTAILTGKITSVKTPYDDVQFHNITVIIQIGDLEDKRIECYRLKGEGCEDLAVGDTITVSGTLKNYNGTIEFDAGCALLNVVPGERVQAPTDPKAIVDAAYALNDGESLPYASTLTGTITEIKTPYDSGYKNLSVIITIAGCEDKPILCYRLKGEGAENLAVGDTITVNGYIINYRGTIEYTAGCVLKKVVAGNGSNTDPSVSTPSGSTGGSNAPSTPATNGTPSTNPPTVTPQGSATIDFSNKANRVEYSTEKQVWKQNGITVINEKGASTTNVGDYAKPGRFYKRSTVTIEYPGMTMIVIDSVTYDDNDYAAPWAVLNDSNAQAVVIDGDVTIVFKKPVNSFTWAEMSAQGRAYEITVSTTKNPVLPEAPEQPEQPDVPAVSDGKIVTNPKAGVAYKFGLNQTVKGAIYYFTGKMSGYYGATETDVSKAVDMYVEVVTGGYKLYFNDASGNKQYIKLEQSGTHYNFTFGAEGSVFTWDAERNAFHAPCGDQECYMGTYGTYVTVGALTSSKLKDTDYIARLYEA